MSAPMIPEKIGRYEIKAELGRGAMGVVYRATDPTIGRTVALKTTRVDIHGADSANTLRRFQNEARAAGALNHRNIVTIYDAGEADGIFYIAMEVIEGTTLSGLIHQRRILTSAEVVNIGCQICAGLDYAHSRGVVHRDIKPANIMIAGDGTVKIMDFGIAKAGGGLTNTGEVLGTPNYMSPEQVKGRVLDGRSDLFSTGVILYEMTTGERPFAGQNVTTIIYKIVNETPIPPRDLDVTIPAGLSAVITRALAKLPEDRYQTGIDLAQALQTCHSERGLSTAKLPSGVWEPVPARTQRAPAAGNESSVPALPMESRGLRLVTSSGSAAAAAMAPVAEPPTSAPASSVLIPEVHPHKPISTLALFAMLALMLLAAAGVIRIVRQQQQARLVLHKPSAQHIAQPTPAPAVPAVAPAPQTTPTVAAQSPAASQAQVPTISAPESAVPDSIPTIPVLGELRVTSTPPGAHIQIDGRTQPNWVTPLRRLFLRAGRHDVSLTLNGFRTLSRRVDIIGGKNVLLDLPLEQLKSIFSVTSTPPGAEILIDGNVTGMVTPAQVTVTPGQHRIVVRKVGFKRAETLADAGAGQTLKFDANLQPQPSEEQPQNWQAWRRWFQTGSIPDGKGVVEIRTEPQGAQIWVNNFQVPRTTPLRFPVNPGSYKVTLKLNGYKPVTRTIQVEAGKVVAIAEPLEKQ